MSTIDRAALVELVMEPLFTDEAEANLSVIAKALLAPLRELHVGYCATCALLHPCPTVRLLDAIEAEVQP